MKFILLDHQDSESNLTMTALSIEKDFGVPKRKRLIIKSGIADPKAETETETVKKKIDHHHHHHQEDSKSIKNSDYRESVRKLLAEAFSRVSSETDESISPAFDPVEVAASVESAMYERIGWSNPIKKAKYQSVLFNLKDPKN